MKVPGSRPEFQQCVAARCSVLQCDCLDLAVCRSALQCVVMCCSVIVWVVQCVAVVLQLCCSCGACNAVVLQCDFQGRAVCCRCVAVVL